MKASLNIGNDNHFDETSYKGLVDGIVSIFESSEKHHIDEATTRKALEVLTDLAGVRNITVTSSSFVNNPTPSAINIEKDNVTDIEDEDDDE